MNENYEAQIQEWFPLGNLSGEEYNTDCPSPHCPKPQGHFYINLLTGKAYCQRCNISFSNFENILFFIGKGQSLLSSPLLRYDRDNGSKGIQEVVWTTGLSLSAKYYLRRRGIGAKEIREFQLQGGDKDWRGYVIFTCFNTGYQYGRVVSFRQKRYRFPARREKGASLFTHPDFLDSNFPKKIIIVEGAFDVIRIEQALGYPCIAVGLLGSYLSEEQMLFLRRVKEAYIWLDPDATGKAHIIQKKLFAWGIWNRVVYHSRESADCSLHEIRYLFGVGG